MPALVAFGRRWAIGSDDFVFPGITSVFIRLLWVAAVCAVYISNKETLRCPGGELLEIYFIGFIALVSFTIILELVIVYVSGQGSITNTHPRRFMPQLLYLRLVIFFLELVWSAVGAYWGFSKWEERSSDEGDSCDIEVVRAVKGTVITSWIISFIILIAVIIFFDPLGNLNEDPHENTEDGMDGLSQSREFLATTSNAAKQVWERRCRLLCCCAGSDENSQDAFADVSALMAVFFKNLDIVPSDIAAGLVLLQYDQERHIRRGERPHIPKRNIPTIVPTEVPLEVEVRKASHFIFYALGCYGWMFYVYDNLLCGLCKLSKNCRCCMCCRSDRVSQYDNCCDCNTSAVKQLTKLNDDDIVHMSYKNKIYEVPFFVALDHHEKAVVISIRGTLSLKDALTDATADSEKMDIEGREIYAHKGILRSATTIKTILTENQILEKAFQKAKSDDYSVVVVGHSLGAGTASLLSIMLKSRWPSLSCFAYAPPGGLVSDAGVNYSADFICSVVLGEDVVPRLTLETLDDLKERMASVIKKSNRPKYQLMLGACWYTICGFPEKLPDDEEGSGQHEALDPQQPLIVDAPGSPARQVYSGEGSSTSSTSQGVQKIPLFPPGHFIWIKEKDLTNRTFCKNKCYEAQFGRHDDFSYIIVNPSMVTDHLPNNLFRALCYLNEQQPTEEV
ncbi:sn1-specific diacylglycerol lipase beta-like [Anneissia japonica]|uniref:sn1-specific diacylglycerol lipase beta-like n=1 Tax=Anneissia japonica TaxID=1529436 RepID=UPI0014255750|nr:sn1-specific diacylglycerol lipase beta-like [Anneissia japonica]